MEKDRKVALFIDAENVGSEYADKIIGIAESYGELIIKRIYGGSKTKPIADWREKAGEYGIISQIRYVYTAKKNASDIALAVDAMNALHERNADVFCIASSDSDFTALAHELRERGKKVIGIGLKTANPTYRSSLSEKYYELDSDIGTAKTEKVVKSDKADNSNSKTDEYIKEINAGIDLLISEKGSALMATLGNRLRNNKKINFSEFYDKNKDGNLTDYLLKFDEIKARYDKVGKKTDTALVKKNQKQDAKPVGEVKANSAPKDTQSLKNQSNKPNPNANNGKSDGDGNGKKNKQPSQKNKKSNANNNGGNNKSKNLSEE